MLGGSTSGTDRLRIDAGLSWHLSDNETEIVHGPVAGSPPRVGLTFGSPRYSQTTGQFGDTYGKFTQTVYVFGDPEVFTTHEDWRSNLINNYHTDVVYTNYGTEYQSAFTPAESILLGYESATATGQTRFEYNYYTQPYETGIAGATISERILPHLYTFYLDKDRLTEVLDTSDTTDLGAFIGGESYLTYENFITLNYSLPMSWVTDARSMPSEPTSYFRFVGESQGNYFSEWANAYPTAVSTSPEVGNLTNYYKNIIVPKTTAQLMQTYNTYAQLYPMFAEISFDLLGADIPLEDRPFYNYFDTGRAGPTLHPWQSKRFINNLIRAVVAGDNVSAGPGEVYIANKAFSEEHSRVVVSEGPPTLGSFTFNSERPTFNLGAWLISNLPGDGGSWIDLQRGSNIENYAEAREGLNEEDWLLLRNFKPEGDEDFLSSLEARFASTDLRLAMINNTSGFSGFGEPLSEGGITMTYEESLNGSLAHGEDLYFRVKKYGVTSGVRDAEPIQTYIFPNTSETMNRINIIDTQLKYSRHYEYEIMVGRLVVGAETRYRQVDIFSAAGKRSQAPLIFTSAPDEVQGQYFTVSSEEEFNPTDPVSDVATALFSTQPDDLHTRRIARIITETRPALRVIEVPYLSKNFSSAAGSRFGVGAALDSPPLPPDVGVVPYKGINNKILFTFNTSVGSLQHTPPSTGDTEYYETLLNMERQLNPLQTTILYENDDLSTTFELFRLTEQPTTWEKFNQGHRQVIEASSEQTGFEKISSTAYVDTIFPNTPYYYMFRATDIHGHTSYPSEIYEIVLQDVDGAVFPRVRTVGLLGDNDRKTQTKKLRRFLQIKPQVSQVVLNLADESLADLSGETAPIGHTLPMGVEDVSLWGKTFKVRLTSKKTGKKVDLNINFKKEYDDTRTGG